MWFYDPVAEVELAHQRLESLRGDARRLRIRRPGSSNPATALFDRVVLRASEGARRREAKRRAEGGLHISSNYRGRDLAS